MRGAALSRRGFTLIELLIVIGVVVALAALAFPVYSPMLDRQRFDSAVESAMSQCAQARAAAQSRGVAIELVIASDGTRMEARQVDLLADAEDDPADSRSFSVDGMEAGLKGSAIGQAQRAKAQQRTRAAAARAPGADKACSGESGDSDEGASVMSDPWAALELCDGVTASVEAPPATDERGEFAGSTDGRVALFLPDGTAIAARGFWMMDGPRAARVDIDALLGNAVRRESVARTNMARDGEAREHVTRAGAVRGSQAQGADGAAEDAP